MSALDILAKRFDLEAAQRQNARIAADNLTRHVPRFAQISCSQCGGCFGPGDHGFSSCNSHLIECRLSGQISDAQWEVHFADTPGLADADKARVLLDWANTVKPLLPAQLAHLDAVDAELDATAEEDGAYKPRYRVEKSKGGFWGFVVLCGNGTMELFVGHRKACDHVAQALQTAYLDGVFVGNGGYAKAITLPASAFMVGAAHDAESIEQGDAA